MLAVLDSEGSTFKCNYRQVQNWKRKGEHSAPASEEMWR